MRDSKNSHFSSGIPHENPNSLLFIGRATHIAHMATHDEKYCEVVGTCPSCGKPASYYGSNSSKARENGNNHNWICVECEQKYGASHAHRPGAK